MGAMIGVHDNPQTCRFADAQGGSVQAMACVDKIGLAGMQEAEVAQKLAFRVLIAQFAGNDQRRPEAIPSLAEAGQAIVNHSQIAPRTRGARASVEREI